jgi:signal transduction histidine kinase
LDLVHFQDGPEDVFINREVLDNRAPLLALSVQDNGPGIAESVLPRIFEAYFSSGAQHQGTGLGLCIVQRLLREARGACHAHTRCGQGTIFTVYIPAHYGKADSSRNGRKGRAATDVEHLT